MKTLFLIFLILPFLTYSQINKDSIWRKDLIGIWQQETPVVGNGYDQVYIFYNDGSFKLITNSWEETSNNYGFKGHYKIKKGTQTLTITIDSVIQGKACHYEYGDNPGGTADWQFKCKEVVTTKYISEKKTFEISVEWTKPDEKFKDIGFLLKCILMDDTYVYYKVSDKPGME
jgi:hypothetical protein